MGHTDEFPKGYHRYLEQFGSALKSKRVNRELMDFAKDEGIIPDVARARTEVGLFPSGSEEMLERARLEETQRVLALKHASIITQQELRKAQEMRGAVASRGADPQRSLIVAEEGIDLLMIPPWSEADQAAMDKLLERSVWRKLADMFRLT